MPEDLREQVAKARLQAHDCEIDRSILPHHGWRIADLEERFNEKVPVTELSLREDRLADWVRVKRSITRADLFTLTRRLPERLDIEATVQLLLNIQAWVLGREPRDRAAAAHPAERLESFASDLVAAVPLLGDGRPVEAYYLLHGPDERDGKVDVSVPGSAFCSTSLYFSDPHNQPGQVSRRPTALILDASMAAALNTLVPGQPLGQFAEDRWTAPQYAFYTSLMHRLAKEASTDSVTVSAGMIEASLRGVADRNGTAD